MHQNFNKGKTVQDEIDNLKKRRDDRKNKENRKMSLANNNHEFIGKAMDKDYEKMIRYKKADIFLPMNLILIQMLIIQRYLLLSEKDLYQKRKYQMEK